MNDQKLEKNGVEVVANFSSNSIYRKSPHRLWSPLGAV